MNVHNTNEDVVSKSPKARERSKFEKWMRKYWGGIDISVKYIGREAFEYDETAAQTAWEVWARFNDIKP